MHSNCFILFDCLNAAFQSHERQCVFACSAVCTAQTGTPARSKDLATVEQTKAALSEVTLRCALQRGGIRRSRVSGHLPSRSQHAACTCHSNQRFTHARVSLVATVNHRMRGCACVCSISFYPICWFLSFEKQRSVFHFLFTCFTSFVQHKRQLMIPT